MIYHLWRENSKLIIMTNYDYKTVSIDYHLDFGVNWRNNMMIFFDILAPKFNSGKLNHNLSKKKKYILIQYSVIEPTLSELSNFVRIILLFPNCPTLSKLSICVRIVKLCPIVQFVRII